MLLASNLYQTAKLSLNSKTKIVFNKNIEFCVVVSTKDTFNYVLNIEDVMGSFTNLRIGPINSPNYLLKDPTTKLHQTTLNQLQNPYNFVIECEADFKAISYGRFDISIRFPSDVLKYLNVFECYADQFVISNYAFYKLQYFVKKVAAHLIEVTIKNPHKLQINGQKDDYTYTTIVSKDLNLILPIVFDPKIMEILNQNAKDGIQEPGKSSVSDCVETATEKSITIDSESDMSTEDEITKEDTSIEVVEEISSDDTVSNATTSENQIPVDASQQTSEKQTLEKTVTDEPTTASKPTLSPTSFPLNDYVILISCDGKRIFSSASLLTRHSYIFATILKNISKSPVKINMEEFFSETVYAALDFLNGKSDVINGKEIQLYYFAEKYSIHDLKNACCSKFDEILCPANVCEIIQIAYANYFEELKQKCINLINKKQEEIDPIKFKNLPEEIRLEILATHSLKLKDI